MASGKRAALTVGILLISALVATGCTATKGTTSSTSGSASVNGSGSSTQSTSAESGSGEAVNATSADQVCSSFLGDEKLATFLKTIGLPDDQKQVDFRGSSPGVSGIPPFAATLHCNFGSSLLVEWDVLQNPGDIDKLKSFDASHAFTGTAAGQAATIGGLAASVTHASGYPGHLGSPIDVSTFVVYPTSDSRIAVSVLAQSGSALTVDDVVAAFDSAIQGLAKDQKPTA